MKRIINYLLITTLQKEPSRTRTCAYQGVRNASFLENFAYVLMDDP